jgi:orotidine-5'-phosphate decarboxylase
MLNKDQLIEQIFRKKSYLCIGLDTDINKIPKHLLTQEDPVYAFNKAIIDETQHLAVAYKPNLAFYEARGPEGLLSLRKTQEYVSITGCLSIADAKRSDIGNTAEQYAKAFFDKSSSGFDFDGVTLNPYMGYDSIEPFLKYEDKWSILLALTSNTSAQDFEFHGYHARPNKSFPLYLEVLKKSKKWANEDQIMYVIGATQVSNIYLAEIFAQVRAIVPDHFLLVPGVGAQGGDLYHVSKSGLIEHDCGLLVNLSRSIIYASDGEDFASAAATEAKKVQEDMETYLHMFC